MVKKLIKSLIYFDYDNFIFFNGGKWVFILFVFYGGEVGGFEFGDLKGGMINCIFLYRSFDVEYIILYSNNSIVNKFFVNFME